MLRNVTPVFARTPLAWPPQVLARFATKPASQTPASHSASRHSVPRSPRKPLGLPASNASLKPHDPSTLNSPLYALFASLEEAEVFGAKKHWDDLASNGTLRSIVALQGKTLSSLIQRICSSGSIKPKKSAEIGTLEDMAIELAMNGFPEGLSAIMMRYMRWQESDNIHRLYQVFRDRTASLRAAEAQSPQDVDSLSADDKAEDSVLDPVGDITLFAENREGFAEETVHLEGPLEGMLMFAIAACALRNDFRQALQYTLDAGCRFPASRARFFVRSLGSDFPLSAKIEEYLMRALTMNVLSRHSSFVKHINNLINDNSPLALHDVYSSILEGLSGPDPFLTLDPGAVCERTPIPVPEYTWPLFLTGFMRCQKLDLAEKLWDDVGALGLEPTPSLWTALLEGYANLRLPNQLITTWQLMQKRFPASATAYRALIYGLCNAGKLVDAELYFKAFQLNAKRLLKEDTRGVVVVYNTMIHWLLFRHEESKAIDLLNEMESLGLKPDMFAINSFLRFYAKTSNMTSIADQLQKMDALGLLPDHYTFSILLTALLPVRKDAPMIVFDFMRKYGMSPNVAIYTIIIDALMQEQTPVALQAALQLLQEMETSKLEALRPNAVTYTSILCGLQKRSWLDRATTQEYVELIAEKMRRQRLFHGIVSYHILMKACLENPEPEGVESALRYYREMKRGRVFPTTDTWYILLSGLEKRREWAVADMLLRDMEAGRNTMPRALLNLTSRIRARSAQANRRRTSY